MSDASVEWRNVQALVMSSFPALPHAAYVLFQFGEACPGQRSRAWLGDLCDRTANAVGGEAAEAEGARVRTQAPVYVTDLVHLKALIARGRPPRDVWAVNVAFNRSGLAKLGASEAELGCFSDEFREGMAPPRAADGQPSRRSSLLGDIGESSPEYWRWGGWSSCSRFDGMLLLYARTQASLRRLVDAEIKSMQGVARPLWCRTKARESARVERGRLNQDGVGHFGLKDGISQPVIAGTPHARSMPPGLRAVSVVAAGEFILGYKDTRGAIVRYSDPDVPGRNLALNGTYIAVRQLEQNVEAYRGFVRDAARAVFGSRKLPAVDRLASKLLGRSPAGDPLIQAPDVCEDDAERLNGFRYDTEDHDGLACPLGAHIRRANPRDTIGPDRETALRLSSMHRLIRRGRSYGPRRRGHGRWPPKAERGIFFISVCSSLAGQFELVQHSWINNPRFKDLAEVDPLSHVPGGTITIQSRPGNIRLSRPEPFVRVRGGAYFFMPGLNAMRELAAAPAALQPEPG